MTLANYLSDDDLMAGVTAFEAAAQHGGSVPSPSSLDLDAAASLLLSDSPFLDTVQKEQDCMMEMAALPRACIAPPKQRAKLDSREKNRLKQATYRQKMKAQRTQLEARLKEVEDQLLRCTASKERLTSVNTALLTRLKMAAYALDSAAASHSDSQTPGQVHSPPLPGAPQPTEHSKLPGEASLISEDIRPVYGTTRASPRPLDSYWHTAAVSHEHILPHLPRRIQHQSTPHDLPRPDIAELFSEPIYSSSISFADVSLVRDALECHQRLTLSGMSALPAETAWYLLFPFEVRPGLRLSHSTTMGSPACHLSTSLAFWAVALECSFLKLLEDRLISTQPQQNTHQTDIQEVEEVLPCDSESPHSPPQKRCPPVSGHESEGTQNKPLGAPDTAVHAPSPQLQLLLQYGIMCGENMRVRVVEAVRTVLRGIMLRYRKQLPLEEWGPVCMQAMHAMQAQLDCVQQCQVFKAASEKSKKHQSRGCRVDTSAGACMGGCMHTAEQGAGDRGEHRAPRHESVATGEVFQTMHVEQEFALRPGLLQWATRQHAQHDSAHSAAQQKMPYTQPDSEPPVGATTQVGLGKGEGGFRPAVPDGATQRMHPSNKDSVPAGLWGLPHEKINCSDLELEEFRWSLAHISAQQEEAQAVKAVGAVNETDTPACAACCADTCTGAVPVAVCGFGSCAGMGGEADQVVEVRGGEGSKQFGENWGCWESNATWPVDVDCELRGGAASVPGWEGGSGDTPVRHSESPFEGHTRLPGITGAALAKVAAAFIPDTDSSQHTQHSDGVAECPWGELQPVAIEMVKLMLTTLHEAYSECTASDACMGEDGAQASKRRVRNRKKQSNTAPNNTAECGHMQDEGGLVEDPAAPVMTHACLIERTQALNVTTALSANLLLTDAPVAYRHMTQPPILAISQMQTKQMKVFQCLRFTRTQKEHFAALWRGWKRRRHALDQDFTAAVSLLASSLPSQPPPDPSSVAPHRLQAGDNHVGAAAAGEHVATGASPPEEPAAKKAGNSINCSGSQLHQEKMQQQETLAGLTQTKPSSGHVACSPTRATRSASMPDTDACAPEHNTDGAQSKARMSVVLKLLESSSNDACMHSSVVQRLIAGACAVADSASAGEEDGPGSGLLGSSGVGMAAAQVALSALRGVHETDDRMLRDYSALVLMTTWGLSEVELRRFWAALLEVQVPTIDMLLLFRTAAHDIAHEDLYKSVQLMAL